MTETGEVPQDYLDMVEARVANENAKAPPGATKFMVDVHGNEQAATVTNQIVKLASGKIFGVPKPLLALGVLGLLGWFVYRAVKKKGGRRRRG